MFISCTGRRRADGRLHARNAAGSPRFRLAAIADHSERSACGACRRTRRRRGQLRRHPGRSRPSKRSSSQARPARTSRMSWLAVAAGKAVFCEKPLSLDADALAAALARTSKRSAKPVFIAFNRRFDPHLRELKAQFDGGRSRSAGNAPHHQPRPCVAATSTSFRAAAACSRISPSTTSTRPAGSSGNVRRALRARVPA